MIYQSLNQDEPIRQGDIFRNIPHLELSLSRLAVVDDDQTEITTWQSIVKTGDTEPLTALVAIEPVYGIVITQDCDAARGKHLCLANIDEFLGITGRKNSPPKNPNKWQSLITAHMADNL